MCFFFKVARHKMDACLLVFPYNQPKRVPSKNTLPFGGPATLAMEPLRPTSYSLDMCSQGSLPIPVLVFLFWGKSPISMNRCNHQELRFVFSKMCVTYDSCASFYIRSGSRTPHWKGAVTRDLRMQAAFLGDPQLFRFFHGCGEAGFRLKKCRPPF